MRTYPINLNVHLNIIHTALREAYKANAAEPYLADKYDAAQAIVKGAILILTDGDIEMASDLSHRIFEGWSGEPIGSWFVANYVTETDTQIPGFTLDQIRATTH